MPSTPKGNGLQHRNKHGAFKARVRRELVPVTAADDVFDVFAGDGLMFAEAWRGAGRGATMDLEPACVARALRERPGWSVLRGNVERALRAGVWAGRPFSVVDVDCFGSPWRFVAGFFQHERALADPLKLVLTDNYMKNRNLSHEDKTLGYRKPDTVEGYLRRVDDLMARLVGARGWRWERGLYRQDACVQHVMTLTRQSPKSEAGAGDGAGRGVG